MRMFVNTLVCSYAQSLLLKKHIKNASLRTGQSYRFFALLNNQFKYFNLDMNELPVSSLLSQHKENTFSHQILESKPNFNVVSFTKMKNDLFNVDRVDDLDGLLNDSSLIDLHPKELVDVFRKVSVDASIKTLKPISDERYENLCKAMLARVNELSDDELGSVLLYLSLWPMSASAKADNFNKVWKALDNACQSRMRGWSFDKLLYFIDLWYLLKLTRLSDFVFQSIFILHKKINQLTSQQLVQVLFYLNTIRTLHKNVVMYSFEHKLESYVDQLSLEELGVAALGFFKTQTALKSEELVKYIINRTIDEVQTVPEITLASILKCLRLSMQIRVWRELPRLLDAITPHLDRFSLQCLAHVALLTAPSQTFHPSSLDIVSQRLINHIKQSRLKDMEKVLFPISRLDYDPQTNINIYSTVVEELSLPSRQNEIEAFPKCFIALLHCLALRSIFPQHLIAKALDMEFIHRAYGPRRYHFGRELAFIDTCIELQVKDYKGPRLPSQVRSYLYGRYSHYAPNPDYKMSKHARFAYDVLTTSRTLLGKDSAKFLYTVPSHPRPDIVVRAGGLPEDFLTRPDTADPVYSPSCGQTSVLIVVSKNMLCPNTAEEPRLNGESVSKLRSVKLLGHIPKLVYYNEWPLEKGILEKEQCLENILSRDQL